MNIKNIKRKPMKTLGDKKNKRVYMIQERDSREVRQIFNTRSQALTYAVGSTMALDIVEIDVIDLKESECC